MRGFNKLNVSVLTSQLTDILLMPSWINKEIGLHLFCQHKTDKRKGTVERLFLYCFYIDRTNSGCQKLFWLPAG